MKHRRMQRVRIFAAPAALAVMTVAFTFSGHGAFAGSPDALHGTDRAPDVSARAARKAPGFHKAGDVTLKRGIISREAVIERRRALAPLKERLPTAGMRAAEAEYAKALRDWAVAQDRELLELQKLHTAYHRLKGQRDMMEARGEDVSRIDPRLAGMEAKIAALSGKIEENYRKLEEMSENVETANMLLSNMSKSLHDTAKAIISTARS